MNQTISYKNVNGNDVYVILSDDEDSNLEDVIKTPTNGSFIHSPPISRDLVKQRSRMNYKWDSEIEIVSAPLTTTTQNHSTRSQTMPQLKSGESSLAMLATKPAVKKRTSVTALQQKRIIEMEAHGINHKINRNQAESKRKRKESLIRNLTNETFTKLGVSKSIGYGKEIGVIAIRDIPKGTDPFSISNSSNAAEDVIELSLEEVEALPLMVKNFIKKFFLTAEKTGRYPVSARGLNGMDVSYYMNCHTDSSLVNMKVVNDEFDKRGFNSMVTARLVKAGEELFLPEYDLNPIECCCCYKLFSEDERKTNIKGCKCKTLHHCKTCLLGFYAQGNNLLPTFDPMAGKRRGGGQITDFYSTECTVCHGTMSKAFIDQVVAYKKARQAASKGKDTRSVTKRKMRELAERPASSETYNHKCGVSYGMSCLKAKKSSNVNSIVKRPKNDRPPGGLEGVAYMEDDGQWHPISIYPDTWISPEERMKSDPDGPMRFRGITLYNYYYPRGTKEKIHKDYFSDDDVTVRQLIT